MQKEFFSDVLINNFLKYSKLMPNDPFLLLLNGHATHTKKITLVEKARVNDVHIIVITPHTSHRMQPLDVSFMLPLSTFYEQETKNVINNPGKIITLYEVGHLFGNVFKGYYRKYCQWIQDDWDNSI